MNYQRRNKKLALSPVKPMTTIAKYLRSWVIHKRVNFLKVKSLYVELSLDRVRASEPCEPCESYKRAMPAMRAMAASHASHGSEPCEPSENLSTRTMKPYRFQNAQSVSKSFLLITWYATFKKLQEKTVKVLTPEFKALNIFLFVQKQWQQQHNIIFLLA